MQFRYCHSRNENKIPRDSLNVAYTQPRTKSHIPFIDCITMMCSAIFFGKGRYFETATMSAPTFSLTCFYIVLVNLRRKLRNDENTVKS